MPVSLERLKVPDAFVLTQEEVVEHIKQHFTESGWAVQVETTAGGHDVTALKNGWTAFIKCKGSRGRRQQEGMVYDNTQLRSNAGDQIEKLIRAQGEAEQPSLFVMANPDLDRVKWVVAKLETGLDKLDIIRLWVNRDGTVKWEIPPHLVCISKTLGIEKI